MPDVGRRRTRVAPWPPPFSDQYVAQARALLDASPVLVIVGPLGGSPRQLASAVAEAPEGPLWSRHVCRYGDQGSYYFAVREIFRTVRPGPGAQPDQVADQVRRQLADRLGATPTLILRRAHLCDPRSIEVFALLAASHDIRLIATVLPGSVPDDWPLLAVGQELEIPPLDAATVADLLRVRFGCEPHPTVVELLLDRSGGGYGTVKELADAAFETAVMVPVEGVLIVNPDRLGERLSAMARLMPLESAAALGDTPEMHDLLGLTALVGELDVEEAQEVLDPGTIDRAVAHGTLTVVGPGLRFVSRSEAELHARSMPGPRQVELFERYAHRVARSLRRPGVALRAADWWRAAGEPLPADLAARAAREANLSGRYRRALVFTDPGATDSDAPVAPIERLFALVELGDATEITTMFSRVDPAGLSEDELLPYVRWVRRLAPGADGERLLSQAVRHDDPDVARRRASVVSLADALEQAFNDGSGDVLARLRALTSSGRLSPVNEAIAFTGMSVAQRHEGRPDLAARSAERAVEMVTADAPMPSAFYLDLAQELRVLALLADLDLDGADQVLRDYSVGPFGHPGSGRVSAALRARLELLRGDAQQAHVNLRLCLDRLELYDAHHLRGWAEAELAAVLARQGRHDEAAEAIATARALPSRRLQTDLERRTALASAHDELGEPEEALELLADVHQEATAAQLTMAAMDAAVTMVQVGGPFYLPALLEVVGPLVEPTGAPAVWQAFARAADAYDIDALVDLASDLSVRGAHLYASQVAQFVLDMARRATDLDVPTRARLHGLADLSWHRAGVASR